MPRKYSILTKKQHLPERSALQAVIKSLGYKLTLEEDYTLFSAPKYLPCTLQGEDAGFTFSTTENGEPGVVIQLQWGGDQREKAAALIVATALASIDGSVVHGCNNEIISKDVLAVEAKKALSSLDE